MKKFIYVVLLSFSGICMAAPNAQTQAAIEQMFTLTEMNKVVDQLYVQMENEFGHTVRQMDVPPGKQGELERRFKQLSRSMRNQLDWEQLKGPMIEAYSQAFTQEEIEQLIAFYQSPVGRKMLEKTPQLNQISMNIIEQRLQTLMPKMKELQHNLTIEFAQLD